VEPIFLGSGDESGRIERGMMVGRSCFGQIIEVGFTDRNPVGVYYQLAVSFVREVPRPFP
jgi:hypothetical protein